MLEIGGEVAQVSLHPIPIVERRLQRRRDVRRIGAPGEIVRDDDKLAVPSLLEAG